MKLYVFEVGRIKSNEMVAIVGGKDRPLLAPVECYLIEHDGEYVLYDTGYNKLAFEDAKAYMDPVIYENFRPILDYDKNYIVNLLGTVGLTPDDINYVVLSHMHYDHTGAVKVFKNAQVIVRKTEYDFAFSEDNPMRDNYYNVDYDGDGINWKMIETMDEVYDLFGDGKITLYGTPGHTPGHQIMVLNMEKSGRIVLTADCVYLSENIERMVPALICYNEEQYIESMKLLRKMYDEGAKMIILHDPIMAESLKWAPEYYE